jgi:hypothetical protein
MRGGQTGGSEPACVPLQPWCRAAPAQALVSRPSRAPLSARLVAAPPAAASRPAVVLALLAPLAARAAATKAHERAAAAGAAAGLAALAAAGRAGADGQPGGGTKVKTGPRTSLLRPQRISLPRAISKQGV